jgi:hypothetical protein
MIVSVDWFVVLSPKNEVRNNPALFFLGILRSKVLFLVLKYQRLAHISVTFMVSWRSLLKINLFVFVAAAALSLVLFR